MKVDLTVELASLLKFSASVATAIRMYSAYNQDSKPHLDTPTDLMWLSESMLNFDILGNAILEGKPANILLACDKLLNTFQGYQETFPGSTHQAKATFERHVQHVQLNDAMSIFNDIKAKVFPLTR